MVATNGGPPSERLAYRKDIDGLRALAVLLVVAFHFGLPRLTGGYIGVDLFFVLSGFLIASLLDREPRLDATRLVAFYARRIRRLAPAFIVVALVTTAIATALLLPEDFVEYLKSLRESLLFRANVFFAKATDGYFVTNAGELPWLHTWTLSVEWQFYALFPALMWLLRLAPSASRRWIMAAATVIGVVASMAIVDQRPTQAYFSTTARFFEFLVGALAAGLPPLKIARWLARAISAACVGGLIALAVSFDRNTPFPGTNALVVTALAFTLVVTGRAGSVLSFDAAAWLGKRSYSVYLWHWPVIAFIAYVQYTLSTFQVAGVFIGIVVLADLTHRFVERPAIDARWSPTKTAVALCLAPIVVSAGAYRVVEHYDGFVQRLGRDAEHAYANLRFFEPPSEDRCHGEHGADFESCAFGDPAGRTTALLIGDSHAFHYASFVQVLADAAHVKVYGVTNNLCLALPGVRLPASFKWARECSDATERNYRRIRERHFDYVVIAERWATYPADQLDKLDDALRSIVASGAVPVVIRTIAEDGRSPRDCFYRQVKLRLNLHDFCTIDAVNPWLAPQKAHADALIDAMRARYPSLRVIDPQAVQCEDGRCTTVIDDTPIYSDAHHLNPFGSTLLGRHYLERFANPLAP